MVQRILVMGASGSGKSTLARRIGERLCLPVVHLDRLYWRRNWVEAPETEFVAAVGQAARGQAWVMDGNYTRTLDLRLPRAEAVVWLDLPRHVYFPRAVLRSLRNLGTTRPDIADGCPERIDPRFLFGWVWDYPRRARARQVHVMATLPPHVRGITLRSPAEVRAFETDLPRSLTPDR